MKAWTIFVLTILALSASAAPMTLWDYNVGGDHHSNGVIDPETTHNGLPSFRAEPTHWHVPAISLLNTDNWRVSIPAEYDTLAVAVRTDYPGRTALFDVTRWDSLRGYSTSSNQINLGALAEAWEVVRIPIADLEHDEFDLLTIERFRFSRVGEPDYTIHIGSIWLEADEVDPRPVALDLEFDVELGRVGLEKFLAKNDTPDSVTISMNFAEDSEAFAVAPQRFLLEAGETQEIFVLFAPTEEKVYDATLLALKSKVGVDVSFERIEPEPPEPPEPTIPDSFFKITYDEKEVAFFDLDYLSEIFSNWNMEPVREGNDE